MTFHDFIFTKRSPDKYVRHFAFWIVQYLFWAFWAAGFFYGFNGGYLLFQLALHCYFVLDIAYTYIIAYYLLPKYFETKRFLMFGSGFIILTLTTYVLFIFYRFWNGNLINASGDEQLLMGWYFSMNFIIQGPPVICAMFLTFKMLKNYYFKMEEKKILTKENADAELQLLKSQIHPHFLFNTLNNIYSFTLNKSIKAGEMVLQLSDVMKYMINDCETEFVDLNKELKMMEDYIGLEKVRYGGRLDIQVEIAGDYNDKTITPLLMIPFIENSFKHGTSKMLRDPWIKLFIQIDENLLHFTLTNSKPADKIPKEKNGIGLNNVKKKIRAFISSNAFAFSRINRKYFYGEHANSLI